MAGHASSAGPRGRRESLRARTAVQARKLRKLRARRMAGEDRASQLQAADSASDRVPPESASEASAARLGPFVSTSCGAVAENRCAAGRNRVSSASRLIRRLQESLPVDLPPGPGGCQKRPAVPALVRHQGRWVPIRCWRREALSWLQPDSAPAVDASLARVQARSSVVRSAARMAGAALV